MREVVYITAGIFLVLGLIGMIIALSSRQLGCCFLFVLLMGGSVASICVTLNLQKETEKQEQFDYEETRKRYAAWEEQRQRQNEQTNQSAKKDADAIEKILRQDWDAIFSKKGKS